MSWNMSTSVSIRWTWRKLSTASNNCVLCSLSRVVPPATGYLHCLRSFVHAGGRECQAIIAHHVVAHHLVRGRVPGRGGKVRGCEEPSVQRRIP